MAPPECNKEVKNERQTDSEFNASGTERMNSVRI
jgi:hypothetical protein